MTVGIVLLFVSGNSISIILIDGIFYNFDRLKKKMIRMQIKHVSMSGKNHHKNNNIASQIKIVPNLELLYLKK